MRPLLSREQSREFDRRASERHRVPSLVLMENAGRGACELLLQHLQAARPVLVVCGGGNNAGDGFVVARRLLTLGRRVRVVSLVEPARLPTDARSNAEAYAALGGDLVIDGSDGLLALSDALQDAVLVVDALFGTGLSREVTGRFAAAISAINSSGKSIVALDLPSGLDADTGQVHGLVVHAQHTFTFAAPKPGLLTVNGRRVGGQLHVVDIGVPPPTVEDACAGWIVEPDDVTHQLEKRGEPAHKGQAGHVLVIAGSPGKLGAAKLAAHGAHRAGAGMVTIATHAQSCAALDGGVFETMTHAIEPGAALASLELALKRADVVAIGPGFGLGGVASRVIDSVVLDFPGCVVVDADALTHFAGGVERLRAAAGPRVLTPHPAEAARLLGCSTSEIEADRWAAVARLAQASGATVLLKGVFTLVADGQKPPWVNTTGTSALAVGGAGDVLTGVTAALATRLEPGAAAWCGAWLHGRAAELWSQSQAAGSGLLAREAADWLPSAMGELVGR